MSGTSVSPFFTTIMTYQRKLAYSKPCTSVLGRIAEATGFGSFSYFVKCFVRLTGMTPNAYRKQFR
ncbi:helix-turn-helix domain-containing protein [Paenibacillus sp. strain BS8-2]